MVFHPEPGVGWPEELDAIFQQLNTDFGILLQGLALRLPKASVEG